MLTKKEQEQLDKQFILALSRKEKNYILEAEQLLNEGANVNNRVCPFRFHALYHALQLGRSPPTGDWKEVTELLLTRGADLKIRIKHIYDDEGTLLHAAAIIDPNAERVTFLLDKGLNVNEPDTRGWTPLHYAAQNGYVEVVKVLLKRGATIDALDKYGDTPLHHAATERKTKTVQLLLREGAKPNIQNRYGNTPLYNAVSSCRPGDSDLIYALVEAAPECVYLSGGFYSPGSIGETPFEWASGAAGKCKLEYLKNAIVKTEGKAARKSKVSVEPKLGINDAEPDPNSNLHTTNVVKQQRENSINNS